MTRDGERAVAVDFEAARLGLAFSWSTDLGPVVAVLPTAASLAPAFASHLAGRPHVTDAAAPRVAWLPEALAVGWVEDGVAHAGVVDAQTGKAPAGLSARVALGPAHGIAVADAAGRAAAAIVDDEGIRLGRPGGAMPRVIEHRGLGSHLELTASADGGLLLFFVVRDDAVLGVARMPQASLDDPEASPRVVRHRVAAPIVTFDALTVASQTGLALVYGGEEQARLDVATVEMTGAMRERPHQASKLSTGTWGWVRIIHVQDGFVAIAEERPANVVHAIPLGGRAISLRLGDVGGPFDAAFHAQRLVIGQACVTGDATEIRIRSCDTKGERVQTHRIPATPADAALRRRRAGARNLLEQLAAGLAGVGYRGAAPNLDLGPEGERVVLPSAEGSDVIEITAAEGGIRVRVAAMDADAALPAREVLWQARLARWIREKVSAPARALAEEDRAWAAALLETSEPQRVDVTRAGGVLAVSAELPVLPSADRVLQWIAKVRARRRG